MPLLLVSLNRCLHWWHLSFSNILLIIPHQMNFQFLWGRLYHCLFMSTAYSMNSTVLYTLPIQDINLQQKTILMYIVTFSQKSGNVIHKDIERGRLQAWWHLVCAIKPEIYTTTTAFSEVMFGNVGDIQYRIFFIQPTASFQPPPL